MKLVCVSDTHGAHRELSIPEGDVFIHAGDISNGSYAETYDFLDWIDKLEIPVKIFIAGNMDYILAQHESDIVASLPADTYYLKDQGISLGGMYFWGSPWIPKFVGVFNKERGTEIDHQWTRIPDETDVLITHTPPFGILDTTSRGKSVGCEGLAKRLSTIRPKVHVFGHVHEAYGSLSMDGIHFFNVANQNRKGGNPALEIQLESP